MGMISEICAKQEMDSLKVLLTKALETHNQYVIDFCKENVIPLYVEAAMEAWIETDKDLLKQFELKKD